MTKMGVPYDFTNFFLNKFKARFYLNLEDTKSMYKLRRKCNISVQHSQMILKSLEHYGFIKYRYDKKHIVKYTDEGLKLRRDIVRVSNTLRKVGIWNKK